MTFRRFPKHPKPFLNESAPVEPQSWTLITALNSILQRAEDCELSDDFWTQVESPLSYLTHELQLTRIQVVILAILVENGDGISWKGFAGYLGTTRLAVMVYADEVEQLVAKRWLVHRTIHDIGSRSEGFALAHGVMNALLQNKIFEPEKLDGLNEQQFVDKLENHLRKSLQDRNIEFSDYEVWMLQLATANPDLPLCRELLSYDDIHVQSLLLLIVFDYAQWAGSEGEGLQLSTINDLYPEDYECDGLRFQLHEGTHVLFERGLIEFRCDDGIVNTEQYQLTRKAKQTLLSAYTPSRSKCKRRPMRNRFLKSHTTIKPKTLYYNADERQQVEQLTRLLSQQQLPSVQQRLQQQGLRKGFACLFYGGPGTGKTETVLQIARETGRDLMQIDIAGLRDKYVGESEKNIKEVFARYRQLCKNSNVMPILFFNEADAIINKRTENIEHSVDKMDNAMQNIILQELEDLDGILIATTNLTTNLDTAFERRFLFKIEFHKPEPDVKALIWTSMLDDLSADDARQLAQRFDFSGGQIENIARKRAIHYILSGNAPTLSEIEGYCNDEILANRHSRHHIAGFTHA